MNNLTQKETMFLQDLKKNEELCIKKYQLSAEKANDEALKDLFRTLEQEEQTHLDTINQILAGQTPSVNQSSQATNGSSEYYNKPNPGGPATATQNDVDLCFDLLNTEKFVSSNYNTAVFEFNDHNLRNVLNHIQKEEQQHGEKIYNYLKSKNSYTQQP